MNNLITINRLADNPLLAYSMKIPQAELLQLTPYEERSYPAILGNCLSMSIERARPLYKLGLVLSFDITPRNSGDPVVIFSPYGNLKPYYKVWKTVMQNGFGIIRTRSDAVQRYDNAIRQFVLSSEGLGVHEVVFAVIEMLKFKNDIILNPNFE